jgi:hypothetical protein
VESRRSLLLHPFLIALYPVAAFLGANVGHVVFASSLRALVVCLVLAGLIWASLRLVLRDGPRAAFLTTVALVLLFSYGHVYSLLDGLALGVDLGRHRYLLPAFGLVFAGCAVWIWQRQRNLALISSVLNVFTAIAILLPVLQILLYPILSGRVTPLPEAAWADGAGSAVSELAVAPGESPPDIYYIVVDTYTRADALRTFLSYDNGTFIRQLEDLGFYVASCSSSNYSRTLMSVASSLNLGYLDSFAAQIVEEQTDPYRLDTFIQHSLLRRELEAAGYRTIALASGFGPTEWKDSDVYLSPRREMRVELFGGLNETESYLLKGSVGILVYRLFPRLPFETRLQLDYAYVEHRNRLLFTLDELPLVAALDGPKFVFVHLLAPHEPFVFRPDGGYVERHTPFTLNNDSETRDWEVYSSGYVGQLAYLNTRLVGVMSEILAASETPPIIVLQGDHGIRRMQDPWARVAILNAYYFPGQVGEGLYPTISPVNTFRLMLDNLFGTQLGLLPDRTYQSFAGDTYDFMVTDHLPGECAPPR